jgi:hypothetical protein
MVGSSETVVSVCKQLMRSVKSVDDPGDPIGLDFIPNLHQHTLGWLQTSPSQQAGRSQAGLHAGVMHLRAFIEKHATRGLDAVSAADKVGVDRYTLFGGTEMDGG